MELSLYSTARETAPALIVDGQPVIAEIVVTNATRIGKKSVRRMSMRSDDLNSALALIWRGDKHVPRRCYICDVELLPIPERSCG